MTKNWVGVSTRIFHTVQKLQWLVYYDILRISVRRLSWDEACCPQVDTRIEVPQGSYHDLSVNMVHDAGRCSTGAHVCSPKFGGALEVRQLHMG